MAKIISIATQKGGVGKTTTAVNLAHALTLKPFNKRVLVVDLDPQANASMTLGTVNPAKQSTTVNDLLDDESKYTFAQVITESKYKNVDLVPSNIDLFLTGQKLNGANPAAVFGLKRRLDRVTQENYDFIIMDCPPNLGGPFVVNAIAISDYFIIPVESASIYALLGMDQFISSLNAVRGYSDKKAEILGILITKYDSRTTAAQVIEEQLTKDFGKLVFNTRISRATGLEKSTLLAKTIFDSEARSTGAQNYKALAEEVMERCGVTNSEEVKHEKNTESD